MNAALIKLLKRLGMDEWLWQTKGIIDHSKRANFPGTQPVRVLTDVTIGFFQNTHQDFFDEIVEMVKKGKLDNHLDLEYGEEGLSLFNGKYRTPKIYNESKKIYLHETFLSYQWCVTYAIYTLFLEKIDYPRCNDIEGYERYKVSPEKIDKAKEVFAYARSIIPYFNKWDKDTMPNPEKYPAAERDYIEQTNVFFTESIKFILCHELAHAKKHLDNLPDEACESCFSEMEYDADNDAIDTILKGATKNNRFVLEIGVVLGILSMLFFRSITSGQKHPNVEDRVTKALEKMDAASDSMAWAFACIGLELWDEQFEHFFDWKGKSADNYKDLYFSIVEQIKSKQEQK
jgi:Peptidase U49